MNSVSTVQEKHSSLTTIDNISSQKYQEIFHDIVGRKEDMSKQFKDSYQLHLGDIDELHHRIKQCVDSYNVKTHSIQITTFFSDDNKIDFPSFELFEMRACARSESTKSVKIEYNFLIEHAQTKEFKNYKISIILASGIANFQEMMEMRRSIPRFLLEDIFLFSRVTIDFVDYVIADHMMGIISKWFDTRTKDQDDENIKKLQQYSHWIPIVMRTIFFLITMYILISISSNFLESSNTKDLANFLIIAFGSITVMSGLGFRLGRFIEQNVDSVLPLGFINLTSGDNTLINSVKNYNKRCYKMGLLKTLLALTGSLSSKLIVTLIVAYLIPKQ